MFKNLKMVTKIAGGFTLMIVLISAAAFMGYRGLSAVADRSENVADTNELIMKIQQARQQEKNFIIRKDEAQVRDVQNTVQELKAHAAETRAKFKLKANQDQMDGVIRAAGNYEKAFGDYVQLEKKRNDNMTEMRALAQKALALTQSVRDTQQTLIDEIQEKNAAFIKDKLSKVEDANRLVALMYQARFMRVALTHDYREEDYQKWEKDGQVILTQVADMKKRYVVQKNIEQADRITAAYSKYVELFRSFLKTRSEDDLARLIKEAEAAVTETDALRDDQIRQLKEAQIESDARMGTKLLNMTKANQMIEWFLDARKNEKEMIISKDEAYLRKVDEKVKEILAGAEELKSRLELKENIQNTENTMAAVKLYHDKLTEYWKLVLSQNSAEDQMVADAREAVKLCEEAGADQNQKMAGRRDRPAHGGHEGHGHQPEPGHHGCADRSP